MREVRKRLVQYCKFKNISARTFSTSLGHSYPYLSFEGDVDSGTLKKIDELYPDLDLYWVITEKGEMIKREYQLPEHMRKQLINPADTEDIMNLRLPAEDTQIVLRNEISLLKQQIKVRDELITGINEMITKIKEGTN
jgi:hypothetical protein